MILTLAAKIRKSHCHGDAHVKCFALQVCNSTAEETINVYC